VFRQTSLRSHARLARLRFHTATWQAHAELVLADDLDIHLLPQIGVVWRPQGTQEEVRTPGTNEKHSRQGRPLSGLVLVHASGMSSKQTVNQHAEDDHRHSDIEPVPLEGKGPHGAHHTCHGGGDQQGSQGSSPCMGSHLACCTCGSAGVIAPCAMWSETRLQRRQTYQAVVARGVGRVITACAMSSQAR
jgi:hypothetical protein